MGLTAVAPTLGGLMICAGERLCSAMCDRRSVRPVLRREIELSEEAADALLVAWLNELIYLFEAERLVVRRIDARVRGERQLRGALFGETFDSARHRVITSFKAATYHRLSVERRGCLWRARVVMDV